MRLIFTSLATFGHLYPLLPLAVAARAAGHRVVFATAQRFEPTVGAAGLEFTPAGIDLHDAFAAEFAGDTRERGEVGREELAPVIARVFGEVLPRQFVASLLPLFDRERPDLVVYEAGNPGGALAARLAGVPAAAHGFGRFSDDELAEAIRARLNGYAGSVGVRLDSVHNPYIDICPASAQPPRFLANTRRIPLRPVGWNEPGELPAGVLGRDRGRPLVYFTLGTAMGTVEVLRPAIDGLAALPVDVLVATGPTISPDDLGAVPANVRLAAWVPQADLLPHVDLVVHHGGSGTTLGAFGAGLPQLLLPQGADQFSNAEAVCALGVGDRLLEVSADEITARVRRLLADDAVRAATARLAAEVAEMPGPAEVVARLPELTPSP